MALLNINDTAQVGDYPERGTAGQVAYVYSGDSQTLIALYADRDLTTLLAQPLVSDSEGRFPLCHMHDGAYRIHISDAQKRELLNIPDLRVSAQIDRDYSHIFQTMADLLADTTLSYDPSTGQTDAVQGDFLRVVHENADLSIADSDGTDYHVATAGGVRLYVSGDNLNASAFGVVADSDPTGLTGTDNAVPLQRLASAVAAHDGAVKVTFPKGMIRTSQVFNAESDTIHDVQIYGDGTQILFTHPTPAQNRRYFSVRNTATTGARCLINGLTLDLTRNPIRTGGSDMLSIGGFSDVYISNNVIPSADNMAISVDRSLVTQPSSVHIKNNRVGGKPPVTGTSHDYGSIGDTGIWVQHAGSGTQIINNVVYGTGDDAIAVAETSVSPATAPAIISHNIARNVQGTAYKSSAAYTILSDNYAENTRKDMYRIIDLSTQGGTTVPQGFQISGGYGKHIGTATAASLSVDNLIGGSHHCGVHLQNAHGQGSIIGLHLIDTAEEAIKVTTANRAMTQLDVRSCIFEQIGSANSAVFRRDGSSDTYEASHIAITENTIRNTQARLIAWECDLASGTEGHMIWRNNHVIDCDFSGASEVFTFTGAHSENLVNIQITGDHWSNATTPTSSLIDLSQGDPSQFVFWVYEEGHMTALPLGAVRVRNNQNPGSVGLGPEWRIKRGVRKTISGSREMSDNLLMTLDPNKGWEVEVKAIRNSSLPLDNLYYRATWDPIYRRVLHETQLGGGPEGDCNVELVEITPSDTADQIFAGNTILQVRGTVSGWTDGGSSIDPLVNCEITWRSVEDRNRPIKIA